MEDPGITRLDIDHYRRLLKLALSDTAREETLARLADAEARLRNDAPNMPGKAQNQ